MTRLLAIKCLLIAAVLLPSCEERKRYARGAEASGAEMTDAWAWAGAHGLQVTIDTRHISAHQIDATITNLTKPGRPTHHAKLSIDYSLFDDFEPAFRYRLDEGVHPKWAVGDSIEIECNVGGNRMVKVIEIQAAEKKFDPERIK